MPVAAATFRAVNVNNPTHKIRIKIGQAEFEAEGSRETVDAQFQAFLQVLSESGADKYGPQENPRTPHETNPPHPPPGGGDTGPISAEVLKRVFRDDGEFISLSGIPRTDTAEADSLLLLIYGFDKLKGQPKVTGVTLMKAARQSGVRIGRVDRVIDSKEDYILTAGSKRGKRYQLNNRGFQHAEEIIRGMV